MATVAPEIHEAGPPAEPETEFVGLSPRQLFWARFKQDKAAVGGLVIIIVLIVLAITAPHPRDHDATAPPHGARLS